MRILASIQKIIDIQSIEGAERIEKATVLGWNVVVNKGDFKVGDLCCYFEIDSLLPQLPEFEFLAKGGGLKKSYVEGKEWVGYRLKTIRLRGHISQGLCFPLSILKGKKFPDDTRENPEYPEGTDVTTLLGVVKYEPAVPACLSGVAVGMLPSYIPKTDEMRIQAVPQILERYKDIPFYMTEKLDGTSMTAFMKYEELHISSRSIDLKEAEGNTYWKVAREMNLEEKLALNDSYVLQGEVVGDNIQKNPLKIHGHTCYFFNVYNIETSSYLDWEEFLSFCKDNDLPVVPQLGILEKLPQSVDELVTLATRKSVINAETWVEGIVLRPLHEMRDPDLGRLSFKTINPVYLLENDE